MKTECAIEHTDYKNRDYNSNARRLYKTCLCLNNRREKRISTRDKKPSWVKNININDVKRQCIEYMSHIITYDVCKLRWNQKKRNIYLWALISLPIVELEFIITMGMHYYSR